MRTVKRMALGTGVLAGLLASLALVSHAAKSRQAPTMAPSQSAMGQRYFDVEPIRQNPVLKWKVQSDHGAAKEEWTFCIEHEGVMYGTARNVLHAIDVETGTLLWTMDGPGGHPAIAGNVLYIAGANEFYAIDIRDRSKPDVLWKTPCARLLSGWSMGYGYGKPAPVLHDGVAYFGARATGTTDGFYHAVDMKTGELLWQKKPNNEPFTARPAVGGGRLYGSSCWDPEEGTPFWRRPRRGNDFVAMDIKTGKVLWRRPDSWANCNPIYRDEVVYVAPHDKQRLDALNAKTGELLWSVPADVGSNTTGLALHGDRMLVAGASKVLRCINVKTQKEEWTFTEDGIAEILNPIICRDVAIVSTCGYVGGKDFATGKNSPIYGLDMKTGKKLWQCTVPGTDCINEQGKRIAWNSYVCGWAYPDEHQRIYVFSFTGKFYCFQQPPR